MERLTERKKYANYNNGNEVNVILLNDDYVLHTEKRDYNSLFDILFNHLSGEAVDKLAAYEDLGFTPEEIAIMAKFYKERTSAEAIAEDMKIVAKLCELSKYKEAEENGLLWRLPCKVGDVLYTFSCYEIYSFDVASIEINEYEKTLLLKYNGEQEQLRFWSIRAYFSDIGSKFFRTKEEAEKALAERGK